MHPFKFYSLNYIVGPIALINVNNCGYAPVATCSTMMRVKKRDLLAYNPTIIKNYHTELTAPEETRKRLVKLHFL